MGEMADMELENILCMEDPFGYEEQSYRGYTATRSPICKYCGKKNLQWGKVHGRWLLYEKKNKIHLCPKCPLPLEVLKKLAEDNKIEYRAKRRKGIFDRARSKGGVKYLITRGIKTTELLDLLEDLVKENGVDDGGFWVHIIDHTENIRLVREELSRRMK